MTILFQIVSQNMFFVLHVFSHGYFVSALGNVTQVPRMLKALDSRIAIFQIKIELIHISFDGLS